MPVLSKEMLLQQYHITGNRMSNVKRAFTRVVSLAHEPETETRPTGGGYPEKENHMMRTMLGGKIHRATVTDANLEYEGSVTVDQDLLDSADILTGEAVDIWDVTNGSRVRTYALAGPRGSGVVCVNGAAAHLVHPGDLVIVATFVTLDNAEAHAWQPHVVFVDAGNHQTEVRAERLPA